MKGITNYVQTRTTSQVRSHLSSYMNKQKNAAAHPPPTEDDLPHKKSNGGHHSSQTTHTHSFGIQNDLVNSKFHSNPLGNTPSVNQTQPNGIHNSQSNGNSVLSSPGPPTVINLAEVNPFAAATMPSTSLSNPSLSDFETSTAHAPVSTNVLDSDDSFIDSLIGNNSLDSFAALNTSNSTTDTDSFLTLD